MKKTLYIGLMSGTSLDGVDGVIVDLQDGQNPHILAHAYIPMPPELRSTFLSLNSCGDNELHLSAVAANQLITQVYTPAVKELLNKACIQPQHIAAIGAHGQTVRHQPQLPNHMAYTIQLNAPALLAELTGITVISDFRSRDIAANGQGAPLVCAFHAEQFAQTNKVVAVLNLGGIANLTILRPHQTLLGFDSGPANALMDEWCEQYTGRKFDEDGIWASSGQVIPELLKNMLEEPFFSSPPPKSTGRDLFNQSWLLKHLHVLGTECAPENIQATLLELTAQSVVKALRAYVKSVDLLLVCGGGSLNTNLIQRIQALIQPTPLQSTKSYGVDSLQVEAVAFAWLAKKCISGQSANTPAVTGADGPRILGAIYQA